MQGSGFKVWGLGFRVWGLGFGVWGFDLSEIIELEQRFGRGGRGGRRGTNAGMYDKELLGLGFGIRDASVECMIHN